MSPFWFSFLNFSHPISNMRVIVNKNHIWKTFEKKFSFYAEIFENTTTNFLWISFLENLRRNFHFLFSLHLVEEEKLKRKKKFTIEDVNICGGMKSWCVIILETIFDLCFLCSCEWIMDSFFDVFLSKFCWTLRLKKGVRFIGFARLLWRLDQSSLWISMMEVFQFFSPCD